jgi:hypothetical protein
VSPARLAEELNEAARAQTVLTVMYRDALARWPPVIHKILPLAASKSVLRARDLASNRIRVFLLAQLEILSEAQPGAAELRGPSRTTPEHVFASLVQELKGLGWHVSVSGERLSLHLTHGDGRPSRVASAAITPRTLALADPTAMSRLWSVVTPGITRARTVFSFDEAVELFMAEARRHAPAPRQDRARRPGSRRPRGQ